MATITVSAAGVTRFGSLVGRQGADGYTIAGSTSTTLLVDQDTRYGSTLTPWAGGMSTITTSQTLGGSLALEGRYVRIIPYNTGTGSVPPAGVTITQGGASGVLIGVYSALNVSPESVGATMPASGYIKINQWNDVPFTASALTIPNTTGANLVPANVSGMEGILAATDFTVTAGAATLTNSSTYAQAGSKSMRIATTSTTTTTVKMANGTRFLVGAGLNVTVSGYIRGSDVKSCTLDVEWFDSTNTSISVTNIQTQNCTAAGMTQYTAAAVAAPANTRWASINVTVTSPTNGGFYYVDELTCTPGNWSTGATATAADRAGWIEVVGVEGVNHTLTAAGQTYYSDYSFCKGSWYEIGTTDGSRATTYQVPTNGGLSYHGGVLVDKAAATNITAASWSGGVATFTSTSHGLTTGDRVFIGGVLPRLYTSDINNIEACTVLTANTFTIPMTSNPGTYTSGGTVAAVEWYPTTTDLNTTIRTEAVPGKVCWLGSATGLLRFGNDNVTSTGGYCPATGLKVRIPNVMTTGVATGYATPLTNALNATTTNRVKFYAGTTVGRIVASQMSGTWNTTVVQLGNYVRLNDCVWMGNIAMATQIGACWIINNCTGGNGTNTFTNGVGLTTFLGGMTIKDNVIGVGSLAVTKQGMSFSTVSNLTVSGNKIIGTGDRLSTNSYGFNFNIGSNGTFDNNTIVNCGGWLLTSQFKDVTMTNTHYWGSGAGYVPNSPTAQGMISFTNVSTGWILDTLYVDQPGPFQIMRNAFFTTAGISSELVLKNIGSYASPVDTGTAIYTDKAFSTTATTATITHTAHGLRNGETIYVTASTNTGTSPVSSARTSLAIGTRTITYVDANTFTITATNATIASGTIDYYAYGLTQAVSNAGSKNITIQNVHIIGTAGAGIAGASGTDNIRHENCTFEYRNNGGANTLNRANNTQKFTSGYYQGYEYTAPPSGTLGTHFSDYWVRPTSTPGTDAVVSGATWTRVTTLATVIKANHGLYDSQRIYIENSSSQAAIPNGVKELSVSVIDKNTFTIACLNAGSASGTLDYRLPGDGYLHITPFDASALTIPYVTVSGTAAFTGAGTLYAPAVNDTVIWEQADYMLGWDHMAKFPGYIYGSSVTSTNHDLYYQINTGSGWSSYKNLAYNRSGGGGSAASTTVTMTSTTGVNVDDYVYGAGIAGAAKVVSVDNATTITVSIVNTGTVSGILTFNYGPNEATFPAGGAKFKVKLVTNTVNTGTIYGVWAGLVSTNTTRAVLYNQATQYTLTLTGLQTGSDISIRTANTVGSNLVNVDANAGTTYAYTYYYVAGTYVDIAVYKAGYKVAEVTDYLLTAANVSYPISQTADLEYA